MSSLSSKLQPEIWCLDNSDCQKLRYQCMRNYILKRKEIQRDYIKSQRRYHSQWWYWSQSESDSFMWGALLPLESKWTQVNCVSCKDRRKLGVSKRQSMKVWQYFPRGGGDTLWFINTFLWEIFAAEGLELKRAHQRPLPDLLLAEHQEYG